MNENNAINPFEKEVIQITDDEFKKLSALVYQKIGINLPESKRTLLMVRLQRIVRELGFTTFDQYYNHIITDHTGSALSELASRISTNYTFFYRESQHFDFFKDTALPEIIKNQEKRRLRNLRIWCAGCSSGEEPYMLVMLMKEKMGFNYSAWDAGVLATDISEDMIKIAKEAVYPKESVEKVPEQIKKRYFKPCGDGDFSVIDEVRREVTIRKYNLISKETPFNTKFHVIFCRNVMIYFDRTTRNDVVRKLSNLLFPGGYLFIGHSETIEREIGGLKYVVPSVYMKKEEL
ncbi:MAG: protein-glutamate O-methyltransferase CheR [Oligoflexales bacterium]|nr:protein-glutamate O-methyltransferase CheR [Oligoflexales bacterium]